MARSGIPAARRMARAIVLIAAFTCSASAAGAGGDACEREMERAAGRHGVPLGVLYAVGLAETGRRDSLTPYALNIEGRSIYDIDKRAALEEIARARRTGA